MGVGQLQVWAPNSGQPKWALAAAAGSAWQVHQLHLLKKMIQAQVSNSGSRLSGCGQLLQAVAGKLSKLHLLKKMIQAQVSNSGSHLSGCGQLLLAVPGKLSKLHLLKKMMQAQVSNSGSRLSGCGQLLQAAPGKLSKLHLRKKMIQGMGLKLMAPPGHGQGVHRCLAPQAPYWAQWTPGLLDS